jgi:hypothetical protein
MEPTTKSRKLTFDAWMREVDRQIVRRSFGCTSADLPDCCYRDWYDDGLPAKVAAGRAMRNAGGE